MKKLSVLTAACVFAAASAFPQTITWGTPVNFTKTLGGNHATGVYNPATGHVILSPATNAAPIAIQNADTGADIGSLPVLVGGTDIRDPAPTLGVFGIGCGADGIVLGVVGNGTALQRWTTESATPTQHPITGAPSAGVQFARFVEVKGTGAGKRAIIAGSADNSGFQVLNVAEPLTGDAVVVSEAGNRVLNSAWMKTSGCVNDAVDIAWGGTGSQAIRKGTRSGTVWTMGTFTPAAEAIAINGMGYDDVNGIIIGICGNTDTIMAVKGTDGSLVGAVQALGQNLVSAGSNGDVSFALPLTLNSGTAYYSCRDGVTPTIADFGKITYTTNAGVNEWFVY